MSYLNGQRGSGRGGLVLLGVIGAVVFQLALALSSEIAPASAQPSPNSGAGLPNAAAQRFDMIREQRRTNELLERIAIQLEKREAPSKSAATTGRSSATP